MNKFAASLLVLVVIAGCQQKARLGSIAFSRLTGDYWQLWTMEPDGSRAKQLTTSLSDKRFPAWTRDGQRILYRNNNNQAFVIDLATGQETQILTQFGIIGSLVESPESDELLVARFRTGLKDSGDLWLTSIDGERRRILTREPGLQFDPAWSPDYKKIAYVSGKALQPYELFVMDSDGKNKRQLTENKKLELLPAFSPNGRRIAYVSDITGDYEIWVTDVDGGNARQITNSEGIDTRPCWSLDGTKIVFVSSRSGKLQLWIMNSDGSNPKQLTDEAQNMDPTWRKDSQ